MFQFLRSFVLVTVLVANCKVSLAEDANSANAAMPGCREAEKYHSPNIYKRVSVWG